MEEAGARAYTKESAALAKFTAAAFFDPTIVRTPRACAVSAAFVKCVREVYGLGAPVYFFMTFTVTVDGETKNHVIECCRDGLVTMDDLQRAARFIASSW